MNEQKAYYDKMTEYSHHIERFKNYLWLMALRNYSKFRTELLRTVRSTFGEKWTVSKRDSFLKEFSGIKKKFLVEMEDFITNNLETFHKVYMKQLKDGITSSFSSKDIKKSLTMPALSSNILKGATPTTEDGKIISVALLLAHWKSVLDSDIMMAVEQARVLNQNSPDFGLNVSRSLNKEQRALRSVVFTSVAVILALTNKKFFRGNKGVIGGYQWVSVLDARTTEGCEDRHGKVWYYSRPERSTLAYEEYPPRHYGCRSSVVPLVISDGEGYVDERDYEEWYNEQSEETKKRINGRDYASVDPRDGFNVGDRSGLTLEQLETMFGKIF